MNSVNVLTAKILGIVLVLVGIVGFIPGLVTNDLLLGIFGVNALHNVIHLVTGLVLVYVGFVASAQQYARVTNQVLGVVYALVAILGFANLLGSLINVAGGVAVADNWLHTLLAIVFLGVGFGVKETTTRGATAM